MPSYSGKNNNLYPKADELGNKLAYSDDVLPVPQLSLQLASTVVALTAILCFCATLDGEFFFDDQSAIVQNKDIQSSSPWTNIFLNDFWGTSMKSNLSHKSYRPLTVVTYRLNFLVAGGFSAWGFHFLNVVLHAMNSILLLRVFSIVIGGIATNNNGKRNFTAPKASLVCGLLFAAHPVHTESIAAVVGRADLLCCFFAFTSLIAFVKHCHNNVDEGGTHYSWHNLILCILFAAAAMFSKEQGITVLGICVAYDLIMVGQLNLSSITESIQRRHLCLKYPVRAIIVRSLALVVAAVILLIMRFNVMDSNPPTFQYHDNPSSFQDSAFRRALNYNYLYSINLWLLVCPWWLCFDWAMGCIPVITSVMDARLIAPAAMLVSLLAFVARTVSMMNSHYGRAVAMSFALMVIPFLPAMNIFFRVGFVIAERNLYLSSVGFVMIVTLGMMALSSQEKWRKVLRLLLGTLLLVFIGKSVHRSVQWTSELELYKSGLEVCPLNAKIHYNVGKTYSDMGDDDEAMGYYREAINLSPDYDQPMNNLGNIYKDKKMFVEAEEVLTRAVTLNPKFAAAWMNLAIVQADLKQFESANKSYSEATKHRRVYPDAYYNWGNMFIDLNDYDLALEKFDKAIDLKRDHEKAWTNKIMLIGDTNRCNQLAQVNGDIWKIFRSHSYIFYVLGNSLGKCDMFKESEKALLRARELNPRDSNISGNLGVLYHRMRKYKEAEEFYGEALRLDPGNKFAQDNLAKLLRAVKKDDVSRSV